MLDIGACLRYYKRQDVREAIVAAAGDKEVVARFGDSFGKRPDVIRYPAEVLELVQAGATSFHASEELWRFPLQLAPQMAREEADELRVGWDLVLDVDCALLEYSKVAADEIVKVLGRFGISSLGIKYSGNKGFHIAVPFEAFPAEVNSRPSRLLFPEAARVVASFIRDEIKDSVRDRILEGNSIAGVIEKSGRALPPELRPVATDSLDDARLKISRYIESFLNIDTVLISTRHLYRMEYSLHEKSGLASVPVEAGKIIEFSKDMADPKSVSVSSNPFIKRAAVSAGDAFDLFDQAYARHLQSSPKVKVAQAVRPYEEPSGAIGPEHWPPCIHKILGGLDDGRKRGLFVLLNFFGSVGFEYKDVESLVSGWNSRNRPPLNDVYVQGQLAYFRPRKRMLPPNCQNPGYYSDMGVKCPESICSRCRNPAAFARMKMVAPKEVFP